MMLSGRFLLSQARSLRQCSFTRNIRVIQEEYFVKITLLKYWTKSVGSRPF